MRWTREHDRIIAQTMVYYNGTTGSKLWDEIKDTLLLKQGISVSRKAISARYYRNRESIDKMYRELEEQYLEKEYRKNNSIFRRLWKYLFR